MKLPRLSGLRTPTPASPAAGTDNLLRLWGGGVLVFLLSFGLGFCLLFPAGALRARIESEITSRSPAELKITDLKLTFPPGLSASGVTATVEQIPLQPLQIERIDIDPQWLSLAGGDQAIDFHAKLYHGWIGGSLRRSGALAAEFGSIALDIPLMTGSSLRAAGTLERGELATALPIGAKNASRLQIELAEAQVNGLAPLGLSDGVLRLGRIALAANGTGQTFRIERMTATGGDLDVTGEGSIFLANPVERSRLNLTLVIQPTPGLARETADLLTLVGKAGRDGSRRLRITGTFAAPVFR